MFEQAFKNIDDVLRKEAGCTTELDYIEQTSWLFFLKRVATARLLCRRVLGESGGKAIGTSSSVGQNGAVQAVPIFSKGRSPRKIGGGCIAADIGVGMNKGERPVCPRFSRLSPVFQQDGTSDHRNGRPARD